jgi:2-polyprenyl-3-methyl-5-hydroxy-6-metoxy-1,4-benzoquinol methylase
MEEVEKYTLLWDLPQGYGNNYEHPYWKEIVETLKDNFLRDWKNEILDVGGGDQRLGKFFPDQKYTSLDIAPNACEPGENAYPHIVADIREWSDPKAYDWVISIDVMEHIPTIDVPMTISNIYDSTREGAAFLISTRPDRGGKKIGQILHMTVRPPEWWVKEFGKFFQDVTLLRVVKGEYCLLVCRHVK